MQYHTLATCSHHSLQYSPVLGGRSKCSSELLHVVDGLLRQTNNKDVVVMVLTNRKVPRCLQGCEKVLHLGPGKWSINSIEGYKKFQIEIRIKPMTKVYWCNNKYTDVKFARTQVYLCNKCTGVTSVLV